MKYYDEEGMLRPEVEEIFRDLLCRAIVDGKTKARKGAWVIMLCRREIRLFHRDRLVYSEPADSESYGEQSPAFWRRLYW